MLQELGRHYEGVTNFHTIDLSSWELNPSLINDKIDELEFTYKGGSPNLGVPGSVLTEEDIRIAMKNSPLRTQQSSVSLPAIERYLQRLKNGEIPPPEITVENGIIIDGNHRYIASRIFGINIPQRPGRGAREEEVVDWSDVNIDPTDWRNY